MTVRLSTTCAGFYTREFTQRYYIHLRTRESLHGIPHPVYHIVHLSLYAVPLFLYQDKLLNRIVAVRFLVI